MKTKMKNLKYLIVLSLLAFTACDSDVVDKLDNLSGEWKLSTMTYTDSLGNVQTISNSSTTLLLTKEIATGNATVDGVRYGVQDVGEEVFRFQYSVDFSQDKIDILFENSDVRSQELLPLDAVGRRQVYDFQVNKSSMVISTETEFNQDRADSEIFTDVRYIFERK